MRGEARNLSCTPFLLAPFAESFPFSLSHIRHYTPYRHFERSREIFLALCCFLLLSLKVSPFPLSHIRHYPLLQERSLDFARDDGARIAIYKHIRCTLHGIDPFPHAVMRGAARNLSCTPLFLASFVEGFPFSAIIHTALYTIPSFRAQREIFLALRCFLLLSRKVSPFPLSHIRHYPLLQEGSLDFAFDDDTGIAIYKHIRCTLHEINLFPHTVISSVARNLSCTLLLLAPFAKGFPFSAISHGTLYRYAKRIPRLRSG